MKHFFKAGLSLVLSAGLSSTVFAQGYYPAMPYYQPAWGAYAPQPTYPMPGRYIPIESPLGVPASVQSNKWARAAYQISAKPIEGVPGVPVPGAALPATPTVTAEQPVISGPVEPASTVDGALATAPLDETSILDGNWHFFGMGGVGILRANLANRRAFNTLSSTTSINGAGATTQNVITGENFNPSLEPAPMAILGFVNNNGYGVRGRFFYYHETDTRDTTNSDAAGTTTAIQSILPAPFSIVSSANPGGGFLPAGTGGGALAAGVAPDTFLTSHSLKLSSWDLEGFKSVDYGPWCVLGGVGIRYVHLDNTYGVLRNNAGGTAGLTTFLIDRETSNARHVFDGIGPSVVGEVSRRICDSGFSLYGIGRGALLVGRHTHDAQTTRQVSTSVGGAVVDASTALFTEDGVNRVLPIGELELGTEYVCDVAGCKVLLRAGFMVQTWFDAGTVTSTNGNLDLVGGNVLLGIYY